MATLHAVSRQRHEKQYWRPYTAYFFAAQDALAPLVVKELPKAIMAFPVAFIEQGDAFTLVAVQGVEAGHNLMVDAQGQWQASYIPAVYRGYPFALGKGGDGQTLLCIREDESVLSDAEGEPFFGEDGRPAKRVQDVLDFLGQVETDKQATQRLCALLRRHGLIRPWPITISGGNGEKTIQGLYRIDEHALNALDADALKELRDQGALVVAYAQLFSMSRLSVLGQLRRSQPPADAAFDSQDLDLEFLNDSDTIRFSGI